MTCQTFDDIPDVETSIHKDIKTSKLCYRKRLSPEVKKDQIIQFFMVKSMEIF